MNIRLIIGIIAGIFIGIIGTTIITINNEMPVNIQDGKDNMFNDIKKELNDFRKRFNDCCNVLEKGQVRLFEEVANLSIAIKEIGIIEINRNSDAMKVNDEKREKITVQSRLTDEWKNNQSKYCGWVSVIDKNMARILVEEGFTPFDSGISPLLKEAINKIKDLNCRKEDAINDVFDYYASDGRLDDVETIKMEQETSLLKERYKNEIEAIYNSFRDSIISMKK